MTLFRRIYLSNTYIHGFNFDFNLIFFNLFICCYFCWIFCWCYFCFLMLVVIFSAAIRNAFEYRNAGYVCVCVSWICWLCVFIYYLLLLILLHFVWLLLAQCKNSGLLSYFFVGVSYCFSGCFLLEFNLFPARTERT